MKMEKMPIFAIAPMVNQSDAPFRALCLKYGANLAYTEMLYSSEIARNENYMRAYLSCSEHEFPGYVTRPLVAQVCGNNPEVLRECVTRIAMTKQVDAIDFNLGCPQSRACDGLFGSYLLDKCHWNVVFECVEAMVAALRPYNIPLFCKIRICEGHDPVEATKSFCLRLAELGVKLIAFHGRRRGSPRLRRVGSADLTTIQIVAEHLVDNDVVVIANGNISCRKDVSSNLKCTLPCVGVMSAEGLLADPAIFSLARYKNIDSDSQTLRVDVKLNLQVASMLSLHGGAPAALEVPDRYSLFEEYCSLSEEYGNSGGWKQLDEYHRNQCEQQEEMSESRDCNLLEESLQISIARQHLSFLLEKSGSGRCVRFVHLGPFEKHVHLWSALKSAFTLDALQSIARACLVGVQGAAGFNESAS